MATIGAVSLHIYFQNVIAQDATSGSLASGGETNILSHQASTASTTGDEAEGDDDPITAQRTPDESTQVSETTTTGSTIPPLDDGRLVPVASSGRPWSDLGSVSGLLTFRGNPTRTYYGSGPVPSNPKIQWTFDIGCSNSSVGGEPKVWCGSGWTGQPAVFQWPGSDYWRVGFGAYNRSVNFLDPATGEEAFAPYETGDIIKGTITIDPDGFPLLYTGSRDSFFHIVALDREVPTPLWKLSASEIQPTRWNDDWDGSALVVDDFLFIGGENSRFFIVKLNRDLGTDGLVTVEPEIVFSTEAWDSQLLGEVGGSQFSIENSVTISGDVVYFTNSSGLVQGWDVGGVSQGKEPKQVFRFWSGDDTDASIVADSEGMLYLGVEYERGNARSQELGQVIKLDPSMPDDPVVWSRDARSGLDSGIWATPALYKDLVIVATDYGEVLGIDAATGVQRWQIDLPGPLWSSPVVVDDVLIQGDCLGLLHGFDLSNTRLTPTELWSVELAGCIESTPAVWDGQIFVGSRSGTFFALSD